MLKLVKRYLSVGIINTIIHWTVFIVLHLSGINQLLANSSAFFVAVTFSFFANARWTFKAEATKIRYIIYVIFMGVMAGAVGWSADNINIKPIITLTIFSIISLIFGFLYSKFIVFRR